MAVAKKYRIKAKICIGDLLEEPLDSVYVVCQEPEQAEQAEFDSAIQKGDTQGRIDAMNIYLPLVIIDHNFVTDTDKKMEIIDAIETIKASNFLGVAIATRFISEMQKKMK